MGLAHATQSDKLITVTQIDFCIEFLSPLSLLHNLIKTEHSWTLFAAAGCSFLPRSNWVSGHIYQSWAFDHKCHITWAICDGVNIVTNVSVTPVMLSQVSWHPGPTFVLCPAEDSLDIIRQARVISNFNDHHCSIPVIFSRLYVERHLKQIYLVVS